MQVMRELRSPLGRALCAIAGSITDLNMALEAPVVFARSHLAQYLDEYQKPYIPWNDFLEVRDYLARLWN